jgi:hypothetical protein
VAHLVRCQSLMADSTPKRVLSTLPLTQPTVFLRGHTRKLSAKVLKAQRSLRTPSIILRLVQNELPASTTDTYDYKGTSLEEVASLIINLKKIIIQQMNIIKAKQQSLKIQNAEL